MKPYQIKFTKTQLFSVTISTSEIPQWNLYFVLQAKVEQYIFCNKTLWSMQLKKKKKIYQSVLFFYVGKQKWIMNTENFLGKNL